MDFTPIINKLIELEELLTMLSKAAMSRSEQAQVVRDLYDVQRLLAAYRDYQTKGFVDY